MLKNYDEVVEEIAKTMMQLDKDAARFQTDIYLYIDGDGIGTVDTFVNVGGNSWLNDDHITVYQDKPHYNEDEAWDELSDEEKEEYLPPMSEYLEEAAELLDEIFSRI